MMLNLRLVEAHSTFYNYLPVGSFIGFFFFLELIAFISCEFGSINIGLLPGANDIYRGTNFVNSYTNIVLIGQLLYNYYLHLFLLVSLLSLCSMIGAIVLTLNYLDTEFILQEQNSLNTLRMSIGVVSKKKNLCD
jgi:NADH:ubiquinone oxidoreductase subunit 6 (subunit J)